MPDEVENSTIGGNLQLNFLGALLTKFAWRLNRIKIRKGQVVWLDTYGWVILHWNGFWRDKSKVLIQEPLISVWEQCISLTKGVSVAHDNRWKLGTIKLFYIFKGSYIGPILIRLHLNLSTLPQELFVKIKKHILFNQQLKKGDL